jgi:tRNA (pseudouridine54-N1)-methyltransferase
MTELGCAVLDEKGTDIRTVPALPDAFLLSDHENFTGPEELLTRGCPRYSAGPVCLHADHAITVLLNERDRRACGWR